MIEKRQTLRNTRWKWRDGMLPSIEKLGLATAEEIESDTLEHWLREEVVASRGTVKFPPAAAAWSTSD
ncbi:MAG TPA: hypothetical protein VMI06_07140 [Terriglobia bacterium]|nr:hypothetical protein [Terriglobia bacterium]